MAETNPVLQEMKPTRKIWIRVVAAVLAVIMLLSLFALDAVRIKLGRDAKTEAEKASVAALAEDSEYLDATTPERLSQWLSSVLRSPTTYEDYYQIATILIAQGEYARALPNIDATIRLYDGGEQAALDELYLKQGSLHAMLGEYDAMEQSFTHISATSARMPQARLLIAQAAIERNDAEKAVENLSAYLAGNPSDADMWLVLGQLQIARGEYADAVDAYGQAIALSEDADGSLRFVRGSCYMEIQEYPLALADFTEARNRGYADASLCDAQTALCSFLCGKYDDCILYGERALTAPSGAVSQADLNYFMGLAALSTQDYASALAYFERSVAVDATRQDSAYYATVCLMATGANAEAVERFTALIEQGYSLSLCYYNRAVCYVALRKYALAKADLTMVVELGEDEELVATAQELLRQM